MENVKIGDIFQITSGGTPDTSKREYYENGDVLWVKSGDLKVKDLVDIPSKITKLGLQNSSAKIFKPNTVLLAMYGATIGNCSILRVEAATNQACAAFMPKKEISEEYLYFYLVSIKDKFIKGGFGGGQPNISATLIKQTKFPLIPLEDQQKIAYILSKVEALIQKRKETLQLLDEFLKSTFLDMFGNFKNPNNLLKAKIGDVCKVTKLAGYEYSKYMNYKEEGEIIVIKGLNVKNGRLKLDNISYIDKKTSDFLVRSKLNKGDIVMTYIGVNIGDVAIIKESNKYHLAPNVCKITPIDFEKISSYYLLYYLMFNEHLFSQLTTNTAKSALNMGSIREILITLPSPELQTQFAKIVEKVEGIKQQQEASLKEIENLYHSLMQRGFKGELDNVLNESEKWAYLSGSVQKIGDGALKDKSYISLTENLKKNLPEDSISKNVEKNIGKSIVDTIKESLGFGKKIKQENDDDDDDDDLDSDDDDVIDEVNNTPQIFEFSKEGFRKTILTQYGTAKSFSFEELIKLYDVGSKSFEGATYQELKGFVYDELNDENGILKQIYSESHESIYFEIVK